MNVPWELETADCRTPVWRFSMRMVASGTAAPVLSTTRPWMVPVADWPNALQHITRTAAHTIRDRNMVSFLPLGRGPTSVSWNLVVGPQAIYVLAYYPPNTTEFNGHRVSRMMGP